MKIHNRCQLVMSIFLIGLLILPLIVHGATDQDQVKVTVENASIRMKPEMTSEVIGEPPVGTVFEFTKKEGPWYEIKYRSEIGVLITGYVHEMFVELVRASVSPPPPPPPPPPPTPRPRINIKLGGLFASIQAGYDHGYSFILFEETSTISDSVENGSAIGFNFGLGIFVTKNIEVTGSVAFFSKELNGNFGWRLPNILIYDDIAFAEFPTRPSLKETVFSFGINFHPMTSGVIRPYVGAGGSYINGKMDLIADASYIETFYGDLTHSLEITEVEFEETKLNKFGFNINAGLNFLISDNIAVYAEGRYIGAKTEVAHPMTSQIDDNQKVNITLGGASASMGVKIIF